VDTTATGGSMVEHDTLPLALKIIIAGNDFKRFLIIFWHKEFGAAPVPDENGGDRLASTIVLRCQGCQGN
jgi:hypothetical protein